MTFYCAAEIMIVKTQHLSRDVHTMMTAPLPVCSAKLSIIGPGQYYGGGPRWNPGLCPFCFFLFCTCSLNSFTFCFPFHQSIHQYDHFMMMMVMVLMMMMVVVVVVVVTTPPCCWKPAAYSFILFFFVPFFEIFLISTKLLLYRAELL